MSASNFLPFVLELGTLLVAMAIVASWLLRTATAPLWAKFAVPALMVMAALCAPIAVSSMMGLPVETTIAQLPDNVELVAFYPLDKAKKVDLWLATSESSPRAYMVELTPPMQKLLTEAREKAQAGERVFLTKGKGKTGQPGSGKKDGYGKEAGGVNAYGSVCADCGGDYVMKEGGTHQMPAKDGER